MALGRVLVLGAVVLTLGACAPDSGTVYDRYLESTGKPVQIYPVVCVDDGHGQRGCSRVNGTAYDRCHRGSMWPKCRDEAGK